MALTGCSGGLGGGTSESGSEDPIRIGYVTPRTGSLALLGEADSYVLEAMEAFFAENPIT